MTKLVDLVTSLGTIRLELNDEKAPLGVENFLTYVREGFYTNTIFHRVIKRFMIQGGGFEPGLKQKKTNEAIQNEAGNGLLNDKYTLSWARTSAVHSATSQFFINTTNNNFLDFKSATPSGFGYAVFGKVVDGFNVVDEIEKQVTFRQGGHDDVPKEDIVILSVTEVV